MSARRPRIRLTGLALLLQALAAFGAVQGLVFCVAAGGHAAVEDQVAAARCRDAQTGSAATNSTGASALGSFETCIDVPLVGSGPKRDGSLLDFAVATCAAPAGIEPRQPVLAMRPGWSGVPPAHDTRLRSVVLLI